MEFTPFPFLTTTRLSLRKLSLQDEVHILFLRSDARILEYLDIPKAKNLADARAYIEKMTKGVEGNEWIIWGITEKGANENLIGTICLWNFDKERKTADIGYVLHPDFQGKGLMQESVEAVLQYGFDELSLVAIEAELEEANARSLKLLERNGFERGERSEGMVIYCLTKKTVGP